MDPINELTEKIKRSTKAIWFILRIFIIGCLFAGLVYAANHKLTTVALGIMLIFWVWFVIVWIRGPREDQNNG